MQTSGLLRLLDRNRAQGSRALREGKGPAQRARPEEVVHVPSGGTARTNHSRHTWEDKARALPLTRPFGRSCDFGGRSCSKIMKLLLKVEAAGIEPGVLRPSSSGIALHRAQVRGSPRQNGGWRPLSRATNRHPATSVDQRDHGGPRARQNRGDASFVECVRKYPGNWSPQRLRNRVARVWERYAIDKHE